MREWFFAAFWASAFSLWSGVAALHVHLACFIGNGLGM